MKKTIQLVLVVLLVLSVFPLTAAAEEKTDAPAVGTVAIADETENTQDTTFEAIILKQAARKNAGKRTGETPSDPEADAAQTDVEEPAGPAEYVLSGSNIPVINGIYSYKLVIRSLGDLVFDNDLENVYQGVNGKYQLHYEIVDPEDHIMIVTGAFDNILTQSPLVIKLRDSITGDTYTYQLDLRTKEGFTFTNNLQYRLDEEQYGYSVSYVYDLLTDELTVEIDKPQDSDEGPVLRPLTELLQKLQGFFARLLSWFEMIVNCL